MTLNTDCHNGINNQQQGKNVKKNSLSPRKEALIAENKRLKKTIEQMKKEEMSAIEHTMLTEKGRRMQGKIDRLEIDIAAYRNDAIRWQNEAEHLQDIAERYEWNMNVLERIKQVFLQRCPIASELATVDLIGAGAEERYHRQRCKECYLAG